MKLSKPEEGFLSNKPVYALIAVYMPMIILTSFLLFVRELVSEIIVFHVILPVVSGIISAFAASIYCDFKKEIKTSRAASDVRGGIYALLISYIISSLLTNTRASFIGIFIPNLHNISTSLAALYVWSNVISTKQLFNARKLFDKYTELYRGQQLQEALYGDSALLQFNDDEIVRIRNSYMVQLVIISIILILNTALRIQMSLALYFMMILVLESAVCFFGFLEIFRWEQYYAGEGLALPAFDMTKRMIGIGIFTALCTVFAIFLSSDKNLFKITWIIDFFKWLFNLLRRAPAVNIEMNLDIIELPPPPEPLEPFNPGFIDETPNTFKLWTYIQYAFIAAAAAGFIWFMISPFINKFKNSGLKFRQRLGKIIIEWIRGVLNAFSSFIAFIKNDKTRQKLHKPSAEDIRLATENILGAYSRAKKRDIRRSATLFAQLIIWGGEVRQLTWKSSHAPGEYCGLLSATTPLAAQSSSTDTISNADNNLSAGIIRCGEIFEKALYSAETLSGTERKEFKDLVEKIVSSV